MNPNLNIISAGAGSGKTYRLTNDLVEMLKKGVRASGIIATTFTNKAAAELKERVRVKLLEEGMTETADDLTNALIGTVHSLGVKLLQRFAYEAGVSPEVSIIADEDQHLLFNQSLATVLTNERVTRMEDLSNRLGLNKREFNDWRRTVHSLTDIARANDFNKEVLEKSKQLSFETFQGYLGEINDQPTEWWNSELSNLLERTIQALENNDDATKTTATGVDTLKGMLRNLKFRNHLHWYEWVKISKTKVGKKSQDDVTELFEFAASHESNPRFHQDVKDFIYTIFEVAIEAIVEYDRYKKIRGLIDYTDMEVLVKELLRNEQVREVLKDELDLLMVDEFQDTSPMQLEIFWQLSKFAKHSIWVGDPKQSIYGFRGAEPQLMLDLIKKQGGIKPENIQKHSWRSREDIVNCTNAIFTKAFSDLPKEQVALQAKRLVKATADSANKTDEPEDMRYALHHWHFETEDGKRAAKPWLENAIAFSIKSMLERGMLIDPKDESERRMARAGDVAILCRSNAVCQQMADALHRAGLKAAISRAGLLETPESKLVLACLKYLQNEYDSLSVAEVLLLTGEMTLEEIVENRIDFLAEREETPLKEWAKDNEFIKTLNKMRTDGTEFSSAEILNYLLEIGDLRRQIVAWGQVEQRIANVDMLRQFALQYEDNCNRLHTAASLSGFLLWLGKLAVDGKDSQGSGEAPDTVRVMTYHRSKGLEFPITICHSLEQKLRDDVFGFSLVRETEDIDLDNILGNRWVRFWTNPYADQYRNTRLEERLKTSPEKAAATQQALAEEARLLYVGITRARDYLVFPSRQKPQTIWINRVFQNGEETHTTLDAKMDVSSFVWEDNILPLENEIFVYPNTFTTAGIKESAIYFPKEASNETNLYSPYFINLNEEGFNENYKIKHAQTFSYAGKLPIPEDADRKEIVKAFQAFLKGDRTEYAATERATNAKNIIKQLKLPKDTNTNAFLQQSTAFYNSLENNFKIEKAYRKYPVRLNYKNRLFTTEIDLLLKTDKGLVLLYHSNHVGEPKSWCSHILKEKGDLLFLTKKALKEIFETSNIVTLGHLTEGGAWIEVDIEEKKMI